MFSSLGPGEIILIALVVILLFGFKRLPDAARSLGRSARVFKSEVSEMKAEDEARKQAAAPPPTSPNPPAQPTPSQLREADGNAVREDNSSRTDNQSGPIA
ncbi:MAG: Sec-independent protein translocase subunit TatA [Tetrasphaera sp.]